MEDQVTLPPVGTAVEELLFRQTRGNIEYGVAPMLFGYRVRAGYIGSDFYVLDWCCGDSKEVVMKTLGRLDKLLASGMKMEEMPSHSQIKPWFKDPEFTRWINSVS